MRDNLTAAVGKRAMLPGADLISIDPGLQGTGVVYWTQEELGCVVAPAQAVVFHPSKRFTEGNDELIQRADDLAFKVVKMARSYGDRYVQVVIEMPQYFESAKARMSRSSGDLDKLCFLVGYMHGMFPDHWRKFLVHPNTWKGQLPKEVVIRRMQAHYGKRRCDKLGVKSHAWDALGIGDWFLRRRNP